MRLRSHSLIPLKAPGPPCSAAAAQPPPPLTTPGLRASDSRPPSYRHRPAAPRGGCRDREQRGGGGDRAHWVGESRGQAGRHVVGRAVSGLPPLPPRRDGGGSHWPRGGAGAGPGQPQGSSAPMWDAPGAARSVWAPRGCCVGARCRVHCGKCRWRSVGRCYCAEPLWWWLPPLSLVVVPGQRRALQHSRINSGSSDRILFKKQ